MGLLARAEAIRKQLEAEGKLDCQSTQSTTLVPHAVPKTDTPKIEIETETFSPVKPVDLATVPVKQPNIKNELSTLTNQPTVSFSPNKLHQFKIVLKNTVQKNTVRKINKPKLRQLAVALFAVGLSMQTAAPRNLDSATLLKKQSNLNLNTRIELRTIQTVPGPIDFNVFKNEFTKNVKISVISNTDRDNLARLLYGEAGRDTVDAIEVLHTILNRYASPLFKGRMNDLITAKNQYVGFKPEHPVDTKLRELVDFVVDEWEANGCQIIDDCNRYYFVTGIANVCNKFEISTDPYGRWVPAEEKQYAALKQYCPIATDQAIRFERMYAQKHATQKLVAQAHETTHNL